MPPPPTANSDLPTTNSHLPSAISDPPSPNSRRRFSLIALCFLLSAFCFLLFLFRGPLLAGAARAWVIDQSLVKADAIVVLGGGAETRPFAAARLYHQGLAPVILVMHPKPSPTQKLGLTIGDAELEHRTLLKLDVPESAIAIASDLVTNTFGESWAVRNWARTNAVKRVIIPTDAFHTRRVRWMFEKQLRPAGIQVEIEAVPYREFTLDNWWLHEEGLIAFETEVLKYAFYRLKY